MFEELAKSDYAPKRKEVLIKHGEKSYTFHANELPYLQRIALYGTQSSGGDSFSQLVIASITDPDGKRMTMEQLRKLPEAIQEQFFVAAAEVNSQVEDKKKAK